MSYPDASGGNEQPVFAADPSMSPAARVVVVDSAARDGVAPEEWQDRRLGDGSRHRVYKRYLSSAGLAAEIGGRTDPRRGLVRGGAGGLVGRCAALRPGYPVNLRAYRPQSLLGFTVFTRLAVTYTQNRPSLAPRTDTWRPQVRSGGFYWCETSRC